MISLIVSVIGISISMISITISIVSIITSIMSTLSNTNPWFSTPKKARNPGHANHVLKTQL